MAERRLARLLLLVGFLVLPVSALPAAGTHTPEVWREATSYHDYDPDSTDADPYAFGDVESGVALIGTEVYFTQGGGTASLDLLTGIWRGILDNSDRGTVNAGVGIHAGRILLAGGSSCIDPTPCPQLNRTSTYDPETDTWTDLANLPVDTVSPGDGVIDSSFYVVGGRTAFNNQNPPIDTLQIYDIPTNTWSTGPPIPEARWAPLSIVTPDGKLVVAGGVIDWGTDPSNFEASTRVDIFDPETMTWNTLAPLPAPMWDGALGECSGHLFAIGKVPSGFERVLAFRTYRYDVSADAWSLGPPMPEPPIESGVANGPVDSPDLDVLVVASIDRFFVLNCQDDAVFPIPELPAGLLGLVGLAGVAGLVVARRARRGPRLGPTSRERGRT